MDILKFMGELRLFEEIEPPLTPQTPLSPWTSSQRLLERKNLRCLITLPVLVQRRLPLNWYNDRPLTAAVSALRRFASVSRDPVVVRVSDFPMGFDSESVHRELQTFLIDELRPWLIPRRENYDFTLNEIWEKESRIILCYSHATHLADPLLWPGLSVETAEVQDPAELKKFLLRAAARPLDARGLWVAQAVLKPTTLQALADQFGGLRSLADSVNRNLTEWMRERMWNAVSVVAVDYFRSTDVVDVAVESNARRRRCYDRMKELFLITSLTPKNRPPAPAPANPVWMGPRSH